MTTAVHKATRPVAVSEAPRNGALSGRDLLSRLPTEDVETPIGMVTVRGLGAIEMLGIAPRAAALSDEGGAEQGRLIVEVVAYGLDIEIEEAARLPLTVALPVFGAVMRLSGMDEAAVSEAVEDLKAHPNDDS